MRSYCPFCKNISLSYKLSVWIGNLKRWYERIRGIVPECKLVCSGAYYTEFLCKCSVYLIKLCLKPSYRLICRSVNLCWYKSLCHIPYCNHRLYSLQGCLVYLLMIHNGVLAVIQLSVSYRKGKVRHFRVCCNNICICFCFFFRSIGYACSINPLYICCSLTYLFSKRQRQRHTGKLRSKRSRHLFHLTCNHFRMAYKIAVICIAVFICCKVNPFVIRLNYRSFSFLQEYNIRGYLCSGICLKCSVRQPYGSKQLCSLRYVSSYRWGLLIQCAFWGYKGYKASRSYLIQCFGKKIVVYLKTVFVVSSVKQRIAAKRYIAYGCIEAVVRILRVFISFYLNLCRWI